MGRRLELQTILEDILGSRNVYFQPPSNVRMKYPCIVYSWQRQIERYADNDSYLNRRSYQVTVIDRDPDSIIPSKIQRMPYTRMSSIFVSDDLNHFVFDLHF